MPDVTLKTAVAFAAALSGILAIPGCDSLHAAGANGPGHNQSLQPSSVWSEIDSWIDSVLGTGA